MTFGSKIHLTCWVLAISAGVALPAAAQVVLPGAADASRVNREDRGLLPARGVIEPPPMPAMPDETAIPANAKTMPFTLRSVTIEGATAFDGAALAALYAPYLNEKSTMEVVWKVAEAVTKNYRDSGYFLSRAVVPKQDFASGHLTIQVVEGFVGIVHIEGPLANQRVVKQAVAGLSAKRPVTADEIESFVLRMNDLPDASFRSILVPVDIKEGMAAGAVKLMMVPTEKPSTASIGADNYGSRFLGPQEVSFNYANHFLPLQQTSFSALSSLPTKELTSATLTHAITLTPELTLGVSGAITKAEPGFTLADLDIESDSRSLGISLNWQAIRQRQHNVAFELAFDARNTSNDIIGAPLTRDKIRAVRGTASFDVADRMGGYNSGSLVISQGIDGLGASDAGAAFLSRSEAEPDFTKAEARVSRLQRLGDKWLAIGALRGQVASAPLYSSEEFGYGGQSFGRAYDASELTGDEGAIASLEMRYLLSPEEADIRLTPYGFYDYGRVWNKDAGQDARASGSSAGVGVLFETSNAISGNLGLAFPLTRDVATPIYGDGPRSPRLLVRVSKAF